MVATHRPKLIVLDIMMPGMDGIEVCKRTRRTLGDEVPIIFLSALDTRETVRACLEAGGDDYVIKSESLAKLVERAEFWTRRKTPSAHARRKKVLTEARDALTRPQMLTTDMTLKTSDGELSSESDDIVLRISRFIALARAIASPNFGREVSEKLYLLGYLTGVVEYWAMRRSAMKRRFEDYLRAALRETNVLREAEIESMLASLPDLATDDRFKEARATGRPGMFGSGNERDPQRTHRPARFRRKAETRRRLAAARLSAPPRLGLPARNSDRQWRKHRHTSQQPCRRRNQFPASPCSTGAKMV